ncbi:PAS domain-containing protein [Agrobacterium rubi]|nr:PAS domain-containing protein [Agrobacterium rubi]NTF24042.1 PAS domain-containing protein [Agrobacterium rubi]
MTQSATDRIFEYWKSLTMDGRIPKRSDIKTEALQSILPYVFILQLEESVLEPSSSLPQQKPDITFRLTGTEICNLHTRELTRSAFKYIITPRDRAQVEAELRRVFTHHEVKRFTTRVRSAYAILDVQTIVMPLNNGPEGCTRAIGAQIPLTRDHLWWKGEHSISSHELVATETMSWRASNVIGDPRLQPPAYEVPVFELSRRAKRPEGRMVGHLTVIEGGTA